MMFSSCCSNLKMRLASLHMKRWLKNVSDTVYTLLSFFSGSGSKYWSRGTDDHMLIVASFFSSCLVDLTKLGHSLLTSVTNLPTDQFRPAYFYYMTQLLYKPCSAPLRSAGSQILRNRCQNPPPLAPPVHHCVFKVTSITHLILYILFQCLPQL